MSVRERLPLWAQSIQARCGLERRSVLALVGVLAAAVLLAVAHFWTGRTHPVQAPDVVRTATPGPPQDTEEPTGTPTGGGASAPGGPAIVVDVAGKVRKPGLQKLPAGSRVADALRAAGGVRPGASTAGLNRARLLVDGEQVVVGEPAAAGAAAAGGAAGAPPAGGAGPGPAAPVSLNSATLEQLDALPGVGPVLAQHIIDYRTEHGGFRSVDELREVKGIGDGRFSDLHDLVRP